MRGPYSKFTVNPTVAPHGFYRSAEWYRTNIGQKIRTPLPYRCTQNTMLTMPLSSTGGYFTDASNHNARSYADLSWGRDNVKGNTIQALHNKTYAKFLAKVRSAPALGVDFAERRQTYSMIHSVLKGLKNPLKNLKKAYNSYGSKPINTALKDMPNVWLAWHFGVEPLVKDLHELLQRLDDKGKPAQVTASKGTTLTYQQNTGNGIVFKETYKLNVRLSAFVTRVDDKLSMMSDFGILNPLSIAWETVPFSFVVDWFFPVGSYLNSKTDLLGYTIQNGYRTWFCTFTGSMTYSYPMVMRTDPRNGRPYNCEGFKIERALGIPDMVLQQVQLPKSLSLSRAATQISLLLQVLMKGR